MFYKRTREPASPSFLYQARRDKNPRSFASQSHITTRRNSVICIRRSLKNIIMGFWLLKRKESTSDQEKAARRARRAARDAITYDSIMSAFVQPLPTFSQWTTPTVPRNPPSYEATAYYPATYYPNQSYENPYGYQQYVSSTGSLPTGDVLPNYMDATYSPYSRQVRTLTFIFKGQVDTSSDRCFDGNYLHFSFLEYI